MERAMAKLEHGIGDAIFDGNRVREASWNLILLCTLRHVNMLDAIIPVLIHWLVLEFRS